MEGIHDLGGMQGFGPVVVEAGEPPFHERWEGRVHGMMLGLGIAGNLPGGFRHAIERMDPAGYLTTSYYEHWLHAVVTMLVEAGTITTEELDAWRHRVAGGEAVPTRPDPAVAEVVRSVLRPFPVADPDGPAPRFAPSQQVTVRRRHQPGHTRCPRYIRGVTGTVERVHGIQPLPDSDGGHRPEPYYGVAFASEDLWGAGIEPFTVVVDLWESYLEDGR